MGILDRIKRRLPLVGGSPPPRPTVPVPMARPRPEPEPEVRSPRGDTPVREYLEAVVKGNRVVLFMKGSPDAPSCGFSASAAGILRSYGVPFTHVDVLLDGDVREGVKEYSQWPTLPQIFVGGQFVGGADILKQLHESGELRGMLTEAPGAT